MCILNHILLHLICFRAALATKFDRLYIYITLEARPADICKTTRSSRKSKGQIKAICSKESDAEVNPSLWKISVCWTYFCDITLIVTIQLTASCYDTHQQLKLYTQHPDHCLKTDSDQHYLKRAV